MNIVESFAQYMEDSGVATLGHDLFISRAPASNSDDANGSPIPDNLWWLTAGGGAQVTGSQTRKMHAYTLNIYYRDRQAMSVYDKLQQLADDVTCAGCLELEDHEVIGVELSGLWSDQDLDDESRTVGLLQVTITTYKEC